MNRQPSRTDLFEVIQCESFELRKKAIDTRTLARAYSDLAELIRVIPSRGDVWDIAQRDMIQKAENRAIRCAELSVQQAKKADELLERGIVE
jgi:hypothetical protein